MPKTEKQTHKENLIFGPARKFALDAKDVGGTEEGVEIEYSQEFEEHGFDETTDAVKMEQTSSSFIIRTSLAEATLENLSTAWNQGDVIEDTETGTRTLNIGINTGLKEHTLEVVGPGPDGYERTYNVGRVVQMSASAHSIRKANKQVFPVEFRVLPDTSKPDAEAYGSIVERRVDGGGSPAAV
jgi:hypothetical protein